jgi:putative transposase
MKKSKFTDAQIAFVLRQAEEGTEIGEVCRTAGISEASSTTGARSMAG